MSPEYPDNINPETKKARAFPGILVARDLDYFYEENINLWSDEPNIHGKIFRKIDSTYYLWLYTMLARARQSVQRDEGKISYEHLQTMIKRFTEIHNLAMKIFGADKLKKALAKKTALRDYKPPILKAPISKTKTPAPTVNAPIIPTPTPNSDSCIVKDDSGFTVFISAKARALVDAIADQAKALGWSKEALYGNKSKNRFPCGSNYGLACFLKTDNEIISVTEKFITIKSKSENNNKAVTNFFNPDASQHWLTNQKNNSQNPKDS